MPHVRHRSFRSLPKTNSQKNHKKSRKAQKAQKAFIPRPKPVLSPKKVLENLIYFASFIMLGYLINQLPKASAGLADSSNPYCAATSNSDGYFPLQGTVWSAIWSYSQLNNQAIVKTQLMNGANICDGGIAEYIGAPCPSGLSMTYNATLGRIAGANTTTQERTPQYDIPAALDPECSVSYVSDGSGHKPTVSLTANAVATCRMEEYSATGSGNPLLEALPGTSQEKQILSETQYKVFGTDYCMSNSPNDYSGEVPTFPAKTSEDFKQAITYSSGELTIGNFTDFTTQYIDGEVTDVDSVKFAINYGTGSDVLDKNVQNYRCEGDETSACFSIRDYRAGLTQHEQTVTLTQGGLTNEFTSHNATTVDMVEKLSLDAEGSLTLEFNSGADLDLGVYSVYGAFVRFVNGGSEDTVELPEKGNGHLRGSGITVPDSLTKNGGTVTAKVVLTDGSNEIELAEASYKYPTQEEITAEEHAKNYGTWAGGGLALIAFGYMTNRYILGEERFKLPLIGSCLACTKAAKTRSTELAAFESGSNFQKNAVYRARLEKYWIANLNRLDNAGNLGNPIQRVISDDISVGSGLRTALNGLAENQKYKRVFDELFKEPNANGNKGHILHPNFENENTDFTIPLLSAIQSKVDNQLPGGANSLISVFPQEVDENREYDAATLYSEKKGEIRAKLLSMDKDVAVAGMLAIQKLTKELSEIKTPKYFHENVSGTISGCCQKLSLSFVSGVEQEAVNIGDGQGEQVVELGPNQV